MATAGIFTFNEQTFLVFNDEVAGFLQQDDLVIEITGVEGLTPTDNSTPEPDNEQTINIDNDFNGDLESAIASLDGLVESSRLCHILGGASNEMQATLIRVLLEEYGNGVLGITYQRRRTTRTMDAPSSCFLSAELLQVMTAF